MIKREHFLKGYKSPDEIMREAYESPPELFTILINRSFISDVEIEQMKYYCNLAVQQILKDLSLEPSPTISMMDDMSEVAMYIDDFEHYARQLIRVIRAFNPFGKESEKEIDMMIAMLNRSPDFELLSEGHRRDILGLLHFAIANVTEGGGHLAW